MEKKNIDWSSIGFAYMPTDYRYVSNFKDGKWDEGTLSTDPNIVLNECAGVHSVFSECIRGSEGIHNRRRTYRYFPS